MNIFTSYSAAVHQDFTENCGFKAPDDYPLRAALYEACDFFWKTHNAPDWMRGDFHLHTHDEDGTITAHPIKVRIRYEFIM